jgi:uncharacterized membrane protein YidH (DUF202 family)
LSTAKLLGQLGQRWLTLLTALLFILVAVGAYAFALWGYRQRSQYLEEAGLKMPTFALWTTRSLVLLLLLSAIIAFVLLFA